MSPVKWLIAVLVAASWCSATWAQSKLQLPSAEMSKVISDLPVSESDAVKQRRAPPRELTQDVGKIGTIGHKKLELGSDKSNTRPFVMPNSMIVQFTPETTPAEVAGYLKDKNAKIIETYPTIGAVQIETDLSGYFEPRLTDKSQNETLSRGVAEAIADFKRDTRVQSATPDVILTRKGAAPASEPEITNVLIATDVGGLAGEISDWGLADIQAEALWSMPAANDGVIFGVMDVGFAHHEDVTFVDFPTAIVPDNHGNHVAGIACGRHNGIGVKGVLPNCFVRARAGDVFFRSVEGNPQLGFMVLFSQILRTLDRFITEHDDVSTFNVSLGYNWRSNFGINPDLPESAQWRVLVESQGTMLVTLLQLANQKGKVIFSAAGNDSTGLTPPISAKYASPFNWAAIIAREQGIAENGFIVGAHGPDGKRASFSNDHVNISCPGVNILSSVAYNAQQRISASSYGKMSGTSMASPYCAAAHILFKLVRPGYSGVEVAQCMMASDVTTDEGTPRLRLEQALIACPARQ